MLQVSLRLREQRIFVAVNRLKHLLLETGIHQLLEVLVVFCLAACPVASKRFVRSGSLVFGGFRWRQTLDDEVFEAVRFLSRHILVPHVLKRGQTFGSTPFELRLFAQACDCHLFVTPSERVSHGVACKV